MSETDQLFGLAVAACKQGAFDTAQRHFEAVLAIEPNHLGALNLLGVVLAQVGQFEAAERAINRALAIGPVSEATLVNHGLVLKQLTRLTEARAAFDQALALNPSAAESWNSRGTVLNELRLFEEALSDFDRAIALKPSFADVYYNRGNALQGLRLHPAALESYSAAIALNPAHGAAYNNRGMAHLRLGRFEDALADYDRAITLRPDVAENYVGRGDAFTRLRLFDEAFAAFDRALAVKPDLAEAWRGRGAALAELGRYEEALAAYDKALALDPRLAMVWLNRSLACKKIERWHEAREAFARYADLTTPDGRAGREHHVALATHLFAYDFAPTIYRTAAEIEETRNHILRSLDSIHAEIDAVGATGTRVAQPVIDAVFASTGFHIAYQQKNDHDLMRSYSRALNKILPSDGVALQPRISSDRIRFGIASENLRNHNGARWAYHWLHQLPRDDYLFFCYAFHNESDAYTAKFAELGSFKRLPFGSDTFAQAVEAMRADRLDILMLPDVGMTASSRMLAQFRIAPIQFTAWGHPVTTGSPNIDFFLSSERMEPDNAQEHYSEALVRLPNLALYLEPDEYAYDPTARFDLPTDRVLFGSLQSLFKYLPQYDHVYPQLAKKVPNALFLFLEIEPPATALFVARLNEAFAREGLDPADYVRFLPRVAPQRFAALCKAMHASVDSIGWSGGNTTIQCLAMDCPVVTLPGEFMRGRHSTAMLSMIGLDELVATSVPDFIERLARLGLDPAFRADIVAQIARNRHKLFQDGSFVAALDAFVKSKLRGQR